MSLINILSIIIILFSCKKEDVSQNSLPDFLSNGTVVLCEGLFQQNNSSLSWIDNNSMSVNNNLFVQKSGRNLGDTGNDLKKYGSKIYIVVNFSSTIEVVDAKTFSPIKQILMQNSGLSKQPRNIEFIEGNAYVTCFDGFVDVIDTSSLSVIQRIPVGLNPEDLSISGDKLYVSNSGGLSLPSMDSTISIIDLNTNTEIKKLTVGLNPGRCVTDSEGDVYVVSRGDYSNIPSCLVKVNSNTNIVDSVFNLDITGISKMNDMFLITYYDYVSGYSSLSVFDSFLDEVTNNLSIDLSNITTLYGVAYNSFTNTIFISDAMNFVNSGYVYEYTSNGSLISSYNVGLNPSKFHFYE